MLQRLGYVAAALVLLAVVGSALARREADRTRAVAPPAGVAVGAPAPVVRGTLPADRVIRARVGDVVSIEVRSTTPDEAAIPALGVTAPTSAEVPATLEFVATEPGRFPVVLSESQAKAGAVVVERGGR